MRGLPIRLSALMELPTIFVFTHDAMGDGEDGPTHQPVEQLASLRAIPGLYASAARATPTKWSRPIARSCSCATAGGAGAVAPAPADPGPDQVRAGFGSGARRLCARRRARRQARSHPHRHRQRSQPGRAGAREARRRRHPLARGLDAVLGHLRAPAAGYRDSVLPPAVKARVAIEQASTFGWERYVGIAAASSVCRPSAPRRR